MSSHSVFPAQLIGEASLISNQHSLGVIALEKTIESESPELPKTKARKTEPQLEQGKHIDCWTQLVR